MNNYEYVISRTLEELALILTGLSLKTYKEIRDKLAPNIPELNEKDSVKLFNENLKMLKEESEEV